MDNNKQIEYIRKRNIELNKQIDDLNFMLEYNKSLNTENYKTAKDLIGDLENIRKEWLDTLQRLHDKENEYQALISDLMKARDILASLNNGES